MHEWHPSPADLDWYLTEGLDGALSGAISAHIAHLEAHLAECADCADRMIRAAQLELTIVAAADGGREAPVRPRSRLVLAWSGVLAAAALAMFAAVSIASAAGAPNSDVRSGAALDAGFETAVDSDLPPAHSLTID